LTERRVPQANFFATKGDLLPGLARIDAGRKLKYVPYLDPGPEPASYRSLLDVPDLGVARTGDHMTGHSYLVLDAAAPVPVRAVPQKGGKVQHMIDLDRLPDAVILRTGGAFEEAALISGNVGPVGERDGSLELYRAFSSELLRGFAKVKAYKVGPEAARRLDEGWRMVTISIRSPVEYDLRR
jgi:hypothetical protein